MAVEKGQIEVIPAEGVTFTVTALYKHGKGNRFAENFEVAKLF